MKKISCSIFFILLIGCNLPPDPPPSDNAVKLIDGKYPSISADGKKLAFSHNGIIFVSDLSGKNVVQFTNDKYQNISPQFSPDGKKVGYIRLVTTYPQQGILISVDTLNKIPTVLSNTDTIFCGYPSEFSGSISNYITTPTWSWAPSNDKIAFYIGNDLEIRLKIIKSDGSGIQLFEFPVFNYAKSGGYNRSGFSWSPTGNRIALTTNYYTNSDKSHLFIAEIGKDSLTIMSLNDHACFPNWSRGDTTITFLSLDSGIILLNLQTKIETIFKQTGLYDIFSLKLSPDDSKIIYYHYFASVDIPGSELIILNLLSGQKSFLVKTSVFNYNFVWDPSSSFVLFERNNAIYKIDVF